MHRIVVRPDPTVKKPTAKTGLVYSLYRGGSLIRSGRLRTTRGFNIARATSTPVVVRLAKRLLRDAGARGDAALEFRGKRRVIKV